MLNQRKTLEALAFSLSFILFFISILMAYELGNGENSGGTPGSNARMDGTIMIIPNVRSIS